MSLFISKDPAEQGHDARLKGTSLLDNPFAPGSNSNAEWRHAWIFAKTPSGGPRGVQRVKRGDDGMGAAFAAIMTTLAKRTKRA